MNLVIDYGNSLAKVGIFDQQKLVNRLVFTTVNDLRTFLEKSHVDNIMISTVTVSGDDISTWARHASRKFILHHSLPLPIINHYATPITLGVDRLAAVCGAHHYFPKDNCLVIDAGSCITYDLIDKEGNYFGGSISPGLSMRFQAVNTFTAKLPLVNAINNPKLIGDTTESGIQSGVINGMLEEIKGIIRQYEKKFDGLRVILCGGDTVFFENNLKGVIFAIPELVLSGLNRILIYNVNF